MKLFNREWVMSNVLFFGGVALVSFTAVPWYGMVIGYKWQDWTLLGVFALATMLATTLGHHRLFAHRAFKAHPLVKIWCLFFGAAAFEGSALRWASEHRDHHRFTDTDEDPYGIHRGFWHAHMGWFLSDRRVTRFENTNDLSSDPWIQHQHEHWVWWAVIAGVIFPALLGWAMGSFWGGLLLGVGARLFIVGQCVFLINSACHMFGRKTYDPSGSARDSLILAFLTHGEGYHSFHHRFPSDYRNGVRWYHWDPTKWSIQILERMGLVSNLGVTPEYKIWDARSQAEKESWLLSLNAASQSAAQIRRQIEAAYEELKRSLQAWEKAWQQFRAHSKERASTGPQTLSQVNEQLHAARRAFLDSYKEWSRVKLSIAPAMTV